MKIMISTLIDMYLETWRDRCNTIYSTDNNGNKNKKEDLLHAVKVCYECYDHLRRESQNSSVNVWKISKHQL